MTSAIDPRSPEVSAGLKRLVDSHGFSFQYAVLLEALRMEQPDPFSMKWRYEAHEFPVEVRGIGTKIDFVLKAVLHSTGNECFLLAECKRANPSLSDWCFLRAPYLMEDKSAMVEQLNVLWDKPGNRPTVAVEPGTRFLWPWIVSDSYPQRPYHIALELRNRREKGDPGGKGRDAIEEAATQLLRGLNGFVEVLDANPHVLVRPRQGSTSAGRSTISILPVIFTTANIWTTEVELGQADLSTGKLTIEDLEATSVKWVRYRYHQSPGITHSLQWANRAQSWEGRSLVEFVYNSFARDIMIVNAEAVGEFLSYSF